MNLHPYASARPDLGALELDASVLTHDDTALEAAVLGPMNVTVVGRTCAGSCRHLDDVDDGALEQSATAANPMSMNPRQPMC